jgi:DNA repair protein RecO (recombination protein O)
VLRVSPYGEDDVIVSLLAEGAGLVPALAKHARSRRGKTALAFEPFHTLSVELLAGGGELQRLTTSTIAVPRTRLLDSADALDRAGTASRWARELSPPHTPEPEVFEALERLYDALDVDHLAPEAGSLALLTFGITLLDALGWGLELGRCVKCGRERPAGRVAFVSAVASGVVCSACGGGVAGQRPLDGELLDRVIAGRTDLDAAVTTPLLRVVEEAVSLHAHAVGARKGRA